MLTVAFLLVFLKQLLIFFLVLLHTYHHGKIKMCATILATSVPYLPASRDMPLQGPVFELALSIVIEIKQFCQQAVSKDGSVVTQTFQLGNSK